MPRWSAHRAAPPVGQALVGAALLGVLLGAVNSLTNVLGSPYGSYSISADGIPALQLLGALLGSLWAWPVAAFGVGWWTRRPLLGGLAGAIALLVADVTYYWSDAVTGFSGGLDVGGMRYYAVLAVPAGVGMGLLGALARQPRAGSLAPGLVAPATIVWLQRPLTGPDAIQPWPERATWAAAVVLTVLVVGRWVRLLTARPTSPHRPG